MLFTNKPAIQVLLIAGLNSPIYSPSSVFAVRCYASACLCCHAVCVRGVCHVRSLHSIKTNKHIFKKFSPSGRPPFGFFRTKRHGDIPTGTPPPPNRGVKCRWGRQKSRFCANMASLRAVNRSSGKCNTFSCDGPWRVYNTSRW